MGYSEGVDTILNWGELWGKTTGNSRKEAKQTNKQANKQTNAGESGIFFKKKQNRTDTADN